MYIRAVPDYRPAPFLPECQKESEVMSVNHNGDCWLQECEPVQGMRLADELDAQNVGFLMLDNGQSMTLLVNTPLAGEAVRRLTGTMVDSVGLELLGRGASYAGSWADDPPEPWCDQYR